jgi:RNA polymerase sigma factor (sigma-70 family)
VALADGELYRKHAQELTAFATGLVGPSHAADVVSEAMLKCLYSRQWSRVKHKRAYLYRCVYNEAALFHRSARRRKSREEQAAQADSVGPPDLPSEVLTAIAKLSVRQRAAIVLTYWNDLDPGAIASLLDISEGSVRRHLARGRARLKEVLDAST